MKPPTVPTVKPTRTRRKTGATTPAMTKSNIAASSMPLEVADLLDLHAEQVREAFGHVAERDAEAERDQDVPDGCPRVRPDPFVLERVLVPEPRLLRDLPRNRDREGVSLE